MSDEDDYVVEGPATPDEDETYGPEPDDPRAAGGYASAYEVPGYNESYEQGDCCDGRNH